MLRKSFMNERSIPYDLPGWPNVTVRAILKISVEAELSGYRERQRFLWLDLPALRESLEAGKASFDPGDLQPPFISLPKACRAAAGALKDGAVLMFVDDELVTDPDQLVELRRGSHVRYLRLFAQRGM